MSSNKVEYVKNYDDDIALFSVGWGYFAKRGKKVTRIFKKMESLMFLLDYGTVRWQNL